MSGDIAMVAGEASGDLLASLMMDGLRRNLGASVDCWGVGGIRMQEQGFRSLWPMETLSVSGYVEVIRHLPAILSLRRTLTKRLLAGPPGLFVGVDAPDFNIDLEVTLRQAGIPTLHFVSPSIWAWRAERINKIKRAVDHMLCVFPFEPAIYERAGVAATYVGHPLANMIPMVPDMQAARSKLGLTQPGPVVAILPGSRTSEVSRMAPVFFAAMQLLHRAEPTLRFVLPLASERLGALIQRQQLQYPELPLTVTDAGSHPALAAADVVLLASGTATLEAALFKKPMVISYKVHWLTAQIMKRQGALPYVGLPNILSGRFVVPELLQDAATPEALAAAVLDLLHDERRRRDLATHFSEMHQTLRRDTPTLAANVVSDLLRKRG